MKISILRIHSSFSAFFHYFLSLFDRKFATLLRIFDENMQYYCEFSTFFSDDFIRVATLNFPIFS